MILLIDNYDSFAYNLYQMLGNLDPDIRVIRNDAMSIQEIEVLAPSAIVLSPGPGRPEDAGICIEVVQKLGGKFPILGVCLGMQVITIAYGGIVSHAKTLMHGKQSSTELDLSCPLFEGLEKTEPVARYHSLSAEEASLPQCLKIVARADDGEIMAVSHQTDAVYGLQFHPESILTPSGEKILKNFLRIVR